MKVLLTFVLPYYNGIEYKGMSTQTSEAIYLLEAVLRTHEIETDVIDPYYFLNKEISGGKASIETDILKDVDIVALSANSFNWGTTIAFIRQIKEINPDIIVILGGIHPTKLDKYVLEVSAADVVVRGEGEITLPEVIQSLRKNGMKHLSNIKGITYKTKSGDIFKNPDRLVLSIEEFNRVPFPDYCKLPSRFYNSVPMETSRGCYYNCIFCGVNHHKSWRSLTIERTIEKFEYILEIAKKKTTLASIFFSDDCFTVDKERMRSVFDYIGTKTDDFQIVLEGRLGDLKDDYTMGAIPYHKVSRLLVGIESGFNEGLKKIRKGYTVEEIDNIIKQHRGRDVLSKIYCSFIIGLPWESKNDCIKTIKFAAYLVEEYGVTCNISWWSIIPSELWDTRNSYGITFSESLFDDPLWYKMDTGSEEQRRKFIGMHPGLSISDREKIIELLNFYNSIGVNLASL